MISYSHTIYNAMFQQDNARPHVARESVAFMDRHHVNERLGHPGGPKIFLILNMSGI